MRTIVLLVAILALANAGFVQKYPLHYGGKRSIMNIMMEVEAKIKSRTPLDTIKGVLDGFKAEVAQEQTWHDEVYTAQKAECDSEVAYRTAEVQDAESTLKSANGILKTANILKGKAEATLAATDDILTTVTSHIELINNARKGDTQTYNRGAVVFNDAINAIDDSIDLVAEFKNGGASFAQIAQITTKFLQHSTALKMTKLYMPAMAALAQLSQDEEVGAVERLGQLLVTLRENVEEAWQAYGALNAQGLQEFTAQKDLYVAAGARLESSKARLVSKIENLQGTISVQTAVQQAASNKRQRNQILLDDATSLCNSFDIEYAATTNGRRQELVLVAELERLAERRAVEQNE